MVLLNVLYIGFQRNITNISDRSDANIERDVRSDIQNTSGVSLDGKTQISNFSLINSDVNRINNNSVTQTNTNSVSDAATINNTVINTNLYLISNTTAMVKNNSNIIEGNLNDILLYVIK